MSCDTDTIELHGLPKGLAAAALEAAAAKLHLARAEAEASRAQRKLTGAQDSLRLAQMEMDKEVWAALG